MTSPLPAQPAWFGQPRGLTVLFLTNMWEQFSYYGMRALLVYYMTKELLFGQQQASLIYGIYTAGAYFTPILGGAIADRYLGKRRAIVIGGSVMAAGHFMMTFPPLFYPALATIALGNGLFLPSLPSQIDDLYEPGDQRVGWAYNVYYVGVNIGGFLAPLACGTVGEMYGWHWGFGLAGVGMCLGLGFYLWGQRYLPAQARPARVEGISPRGRFDRRTVLLLVAIAASVTVFRGAYEQLGNTVALWADSGVDKQAGGWAIPMSWFIALNPLFVMLMTPPLLRYWRGRAEAGRPEAPARRMATGALIVAGAYLLLVALSAMSGAARTAWPWFVLFFAIITFGELFILPTGLGLFARLAPRGLGATTVAAWFLATFSGSLFGGVIGTLWSAMSHPAYFALLALLAVVAAAMLRLSDTLEQQVQHDRERDAEAA
ncbi:peptide MFS transporter [uncultured Sphingomonas sp.]|uniref:peptide MFS transporter n=1 Tax=uncultured Sphingomonas sp. TaxID=158754 RepID=UPI0035CA3E7E